MRGLIEEAKRKGVSTIEVGEAKSSCSFKVQIIKISLLYKLNNEQFLLK